MPKTREVTLVCKSWGVNPEDDRELLAWAGSLTTEQRNDLILCELDYNNSSPLGDERVYRLTRGRPLDLIEETGGVRMWWYRLLATPQPGREEGYGGVKRLFSVEVNEK